jgi:TolA-binding protein
MKTTQLIASSFLILLLTASVSMFAQQSDRAIVDKFEQTVKTLTQATDAAKTVQECADITASIKEVETEFASHKDLLDKSLYPDDYTKTITNLKGRLLVRQSDLGVIESQIVRITELETQVRELSGKIDNLTQENDKLMGSVKNLETAQALNKEAAAANKTLIDSLTAVIGKLRQNLKERDQLIFSLIDSLFMQYDKNVASMNDIEKQGVMGKLERRNVLTNIKKSISDNLQFLESTSLTPKDYAELARQHNKFESQWKGIGSKLANIYLSGKQKKNEVAIIDTMLATWSAKVNQGTWKTLTAVFEKCGIALKPFARGEEFYQSVTAFLDEELNNPKGESKDIRSKRFNNFNTTVWTPELEPTWLPVLVETGQLTADQKIDIEKKVEAWRSSVAPMSWIYYVIIGIVLILILRAISTFVRKKPKPTE